MTPDQLRALSVATNPRDRIAVLIGDLPSGEPVTTETVGDALNYAASEIERLRENAATSRAEVARLQALAREGWERARDEAGAHANEESEAYAVKMLPTIGEAPAHVETIGEDECHMRADDLEVAHGIGSSMAIDDACATFRAIAAGLHGTPLRRVKTIDLRVEGAAELKAASDALERLTAENERLTAALRDVRSAVLHRKAVAPIVDAALAEVGATS